MNTAQLIMFFIQISMALLIFCVALNASQQDLQRLRRPGFLIRSVVAMNVIMPLFALTMALAFELDHVLEIALIALALSPVPPFLPYRQLKAGGAYSSIIGILVGTALFSVVFVPVALEILGRAFDRSIGVSVGSIAVKEVLKSGGGVAR